METVAFLGLLGLGYLVSPKQKETFTNSEKSDFDKTMKRAGQTSSTDLDLQYQVPSKGASVPREPYPDTFQGDSFRYATKSSGDVPPAPNKANAGAHIQRVQLRTDGKEAATPRQEFVSPLSGVAFASGEFKHNNMVPFFKGQLKQNTYDGANRQILDDYTGAGSYQFAKREQTPFFEPTKTPTGNPYGMESTTDFMESRINESRNRTNERPMEAIRVGPGLNQGYTQIPSGGYQQQEGEEYILARMPRTDDLRTANNPKLTYNTPVVSGSHFITTSGTAQTVGEVRKYNPDTFYINENGERNFVTTGADLKAAVRSAQVLKDTTRMTTTREYAGPAGQAEGNATYTVASAKSPLVKQHGPFGYRNADASNYFNKNTDAEQNDYGKSGVEIRPNERFYTGERVHATNLAADQYETTLPQQDDVRATRAEELIDNARMTGNFNAMGGGLPAKQTVYDPNDVLRTTIKETTIDNDWTGMVAPASAQPKLTVYDPNDVARTTVKETTIDNDWTGMVAPASAQPKLTVYDPNDVARTTVKETTIDNDWMGMVAPASAQPKLTVYDPNDAARTTVKETTIDNDWMGMVAPASAQPKLTVYDPNDAARTTVKETTIDNDWLGMAAPASAQPKMTVYDPNDVARTTIKETTIDNDWVGIAAPGDQAQKLTVYDPDDIARVTGRNTLNDWDMYRNFGRNDIPTLATTRIQDGVRLTQKGAISAKSAYTGAAGAYRVQQTNQGAARNMRHYAQRENVAKGRAPTKSGVKLFNGEDNINLQYRKIVADSINDRQPVYDRVTAETPGQEVLGIQRPRAALKLDISAQRNEPNVVASLEENPYVIPLHKVAHM